MQATETNVNASGAPETPASQSAIPDWLDETPGPPEPEECWPPYVLMVQEHEGEHLQTIEMTRAEFIALKKHLAVMRGLPVPEDDEPETAAAEVAGATDGPISGRIVVSMIDRIIDDLQDHRNFIANRGSVRPWIASEWGELQADLALLHEIVEDWTCDGWVDEYPKETKLVGTILKNLGM
jgi:hypothetical protein